MRRIMFGLFGLEKEPVLTVDGERFHSTSTSREPLEETQALMKPRWHTEGVIKPFYVSILKVDLRTGIVTRWRKKEGFSLWYYPVSALD